MSEDLYKKITPILLEKQRKVAAAMYRSMLSEDLEFIGIEIDFDEVAEVILSGTDDIVEALLRTTFSEDEVKIMWEYQGRLKDKIDLFESKLSQYYLSIKDGQNSKVEEYLKSKGVDLD